MSGAGYAEAGLAGLQIWSGYQTAELIRDSARLQGQINDMNAGFAELDAYNSEVQGFSETARYQTTIDQTVSGQRVAFAAQGVDVSYGTAKEVQNESKLTGFLNQLDIQYQARQKAAGFHREARNIRLGGAMSNLSSEREASSAIRSGIFGAAQTGLSGYARTK